MPTYNFSIGKVKIKSGSSVILDVTPTRDIELNYSITTHKEYNPYGIVIDEIKETETVNITFSFAYDQWNTSLIKGEDYDLVFEAVNGKGLVVNIASVKLTAYVLRSAQSEFSIATITFSKSGEIDSDPGDNVTKQTVTFSKTGGGTESIGDSAFVNISYQGNAHSFIVPTALGMLIQTTSDCGGGQLNIRVNGYIKKDTRLELEQYLINLYGALSLAKGTLTVTYGGTSYSITNCVFVSGSGEGGNQRYGNFSIEFIKSAY